MKEKIKNMLLWIILIGMAVLYLKTPERGQYSRDLWRGVSQGILDGLFH